MRDADVATHSPDHLAVDLLQADALDESPGGDGEDGQDHAGDTHGEEYGPHSE